MIKFAPLLFVVLLCAAGFTACGGSKCAAEAPSQTMAQPGTEPVPRSDPSAATRPPLTAEACEGGGGSVVGDIGDGAIHRPEYRCPNGAKPTGRIAAAPGGPLAPNAPIAIEGSVCCPR